MAEEKVTAGGGRYIKVPGGWLDTQAGAGPAPGVTPKGDTSAVLPPEEAGPSWGEVGTDVAKDAIPGIQRGGTQVLTGIPSAIDLGANLVGQGAEKLPAGLGSGIKAGADKVRDWVGPFSYGPVQDKIETAYNRFRPNPETHFYHPKTEIGQWAEKGFNAIPAMAAGGGGLGIRAATAGGGILGGEAGGKIANWAGGEGAQPYGELLGSLMGVRAPHMVKRGITPKPLDVATQAERDAAVAKIGDKNISAGQYTQDPWLLQKEGNAAPLHPSASFKQGQAEQPEAIARALFNEMGGGGAGKVKTRAELDAAKQSIRDNEEKLLDLNSAPVSRTEHRYDPAFDAQIKRIHQGYLGTGIKPNPDKPTAVDRAVDKIYTNPSGGPRAGLINESYKILRSDLEKEHANLLKNNDSRAALSVRNMIDTLDKHVEKKSPEWKDIRDKWEAYRALKASVPDTGLPVDARTVATNVKDINSPIGKLSSAAADMATPLPKPKRGSNWPQFVTGAAGMLGGHLAGADTATSGILGMMGAAGMEAALNHGPRYLTSKMYTNPLVQKYFKNQLLDNKPFIDPRTATALSLMYGSQASDSLDPMPEPNDPMRGQSPLRITVRPNRSADHK